MKYLGSIVFSLAIICIALPAMAEYEQFPVLLSSEIEIPVERFGTPGGDRVLMLPSEYGYGGDRQNDLARGLGEQGFDVWQARLHEAYFQPAGRTSLSVMPVSDIAELIRESLPEAPRKLFVLSAGRGAAMVYMALKTQLMDRQDLDRFAGVLMLHPNFMARTPQPGMSVDYLPLTSELVVPTFIVQPMDSSKRWYLPELVALMSSSGSRVYTQVIPGVSDGYQGRPDATPYEIEAARELPETLARAARLLKTHASAPGLSLLADQPSADNWSVEPINATLQEYPGSPLAPPMSLRTVSGQTLNLEDYRGRVVLMNFWATWCPPCVEEIPSLGRLQEKLPRNEFVVLSVDVGEEASAVEAFLKEVPADYPIMLDPEGTTVPDWELRAFPTTFILDRNGRIRLAYFGGLTWDSEEVVVQVRKLIRENPE
jgi:thiol-disulfide isomerase/thioredoxin